ncbi:hypothetical protein ACHAWF_009769, partial [Thalassiosira exigua]
VEGPRGSAIWTAAEGSARLLRRLRSRAHGRAWPELQVWRVDWHLARQSMPGVGSPEQVVAFERVGPNQTSNLLWFGRTSGARHNLGQRQRATC